MYADNFRDPARKRITAYEYWGNWDINGDGTKTAIVATFVGSTMIRCELNPFLIINLLCYSSLSSC